jgi:predicted nucleic acid-binding protein
LMIAVDTSILAYAEGMNDPARTKQAQELLHSLDPDRLIFPAQVLGELFRILMRKARWTAAAASGAVSAWADMGTVSETAESTLVSAMDLAVAHQLQIWDAVVLQSAAEAGARVLLSEDMHQGFRWRGVTVVNPFNPESYEPLIAQYRLIDRG